jgi:hypothetical protein
VAVLVAVCLIVLLSFTAIALDGGLLQYDERAAQSAADAAALAAADDLLLNYLANQGTDPAGTAAAKALATAAANGYTNDQVTSKVTVNIPPLSGPHTGLPGYSEVIIEYYQQRGFSVLWGSDNITVRARAVSVGIWDYFNNGIIVLDPTSSGSLTINGGGTFGVANANTIVDSNSPTAMVATGSGTSSSIVYDVTGAPGVSTTGGAATFDGTINDNQIPTPDPLAYLPVPDPSTMTVQSNHALNYASSKTITVWPGVYTGGIKVSGQASLIMMPGIYYMDGGGFSFTGQGNLTATGVMVYSDPRLNSDTININGTGSINYSPPTSGIYQGVALWQARTSTNTITISGNGTTQLFGTVYGQHALLSVTGNGVGDVLGSQYISYDVGLGGNGNYQISWQIQTTARTRKIWLVE